MHISDDKSANIIAANAVCFTIACIAVVLRFQARRMAMIQYQADDWLILAGLVRRILLSPSTLRSKHGLSMTCVEAYALIVRAHTVLHTWGRHLRFSRYVNLTYMPDDHAHHEFIGVHYGSGKHAILMTNPSALAKVQTPHRS